MLIGRHWRQTICKCTFPPSDRLRLYFHHFPPSVGLTVCPSLFSVFSCPRLCSPRFRIEKSGPDRLLLSYPSGTRFVQRSGDALLPLAPGPWLPGCSGKYPGLMTNRKISQLLPLAISSARKLASLVWGFLNGLLYDLMQTHFMSMEQSMVREVLIVLIVNYVNR